MDNYETSNLWNLEEWPGSWAAITVAVTTCKNFGFSARKTLKYAVIIPTRANWKESYSSSRRERRSSAYMELLANETI